MIRVLVADDQALIREGLSALLNLREEIEVIGMAEDGQDAYEQSIHLQPDIVLMDIRMPKVDGVKGTQMITSQLPHTKVLMLTTFKDSELIFQALEEGASGYLLKDISIDSIVKAIMTVLSGGIVLPPQLTAEIIQELRRNKEADASAKPLETPKQFYELSDREVEVLRHLGQGCNNKEMAAILYITEGTIKNHVSSIISKLEVRDRTQAAIFAVRYGITSYAKT